MAKKKPNGTFTLTVKIFDKEHLVCLRHFIVEDEDEFVKTSSFNANSVLKQILELMDKHNETNYRHNKSTPTNSVIVVSLLIKDELVHKVEYNITDYKDNVKYKINIRPIIPNIIKTLKNDI